MNDFQTLARFNRWANDRIYDCAAHLSDEDYRADGGAFFGSVHATLNHILLGDYTWFGRITGVPPKNITSLDQILHDDFESLRTARRDMNDRIIQIVDDLGDNGLNETRRFTRISDPQERTMVVRHMLLTVFNHQTHHRGQVHCLMTRMGLTLPPLDIVIFLQEQD